jgi:hypothetical protein
MRKKSMRSVLAPSMNFTGAGYLWGHMIRCQEILDMCHSETRYELRESLTFNELP